MSLAPIPFEGQSMNPLFEGASHILVDFFEAPLASNGRGVLSGEVILYKEARGEWVCHRCLEAGEHSLIVKGDANTTLEVKKNIFVWGVVKGFIKEELVFELKSPLGKRWLLLAQRRQCEAGHPLIRKFYRSISFGLLRLNKVFSIRKYNHFKS